MHVEPLHAIVLFRRREAEERARVYRIAKQASAVRRGASAPQRSKLPRVRRLRPVGGAA